MRPYYQDDAVTIYHADCRDVLPTLGKVDLVLTDPPYPTAHPEFGDGDIQFLNGFNCPQLIFWSALGDFPLDFTAVHIWHKKTSNEIVAYERIFERGGSTRCKLYAYYFVNSTVAASYGGDIFTGHPTQKPIRLIKQLIEENSQKEWTILDPFMGSGTTLRAAKDLNRKAIGIEIEERYCEMAAKRMTQTVMRLDV